MPNNEKPYKEAGTRYILAAGGEGKDAALIVSVATALSPEELEKAVRGAAVDFLASGSPRAKKAVEEANGRMSLSVLAKWMDNDACVRHGFQIHGFGSPFLVMPMDLGPIDGETT